MKPTEILFNKPVRIIQVFRNINIYNKAKKSFEDRKEEMEWKDIPSKSGYVHNNELYLPESIQLHPAFHQCNIITLEDDNNPASLFSTSPFPNQPLNKIPVYNRCFNLQHAIGIDIFKLKMKTDIELHLQYGYFEVGTPERENFKCCSIKMNTPVEIKINGKTDSSLSSRQDRLFKEQYYIYDYIGDFEKCKLLKEPYKPIIKQVPAIRKEVNLLKPLW